MSTPEVFCRAYVESEFADEQSWSQFLTWLVEHDRPLCFTKFGLDATRVRAALDRDTPAVHASQLKNAVYFRGSARSTLGVRDRRTRRFAKWTLWGGRSLLSNADGVDQLCRFWVELSHLFKVGYLTCNVGEDEDRKRWCRLNSSVVPVSDEITVGLPPPSWLTLFGSEVVAFFGRSRIEAIDCYQQVVLPDGGIFVRLTESAFDPADPDERHLRDVAIMDELGSEYFADVRRMDPSSCKLRPSVPIPGVTDEGGGGD